MILVSYIKHYSYIFTNLRRSRPPSWVDIWSLSCIIASVAIQRWRSFKVSNAERRHSKTQLGQTNREIWSFRDAVLRNSSLNPIGELESLLDSSRELEQSSRTVTNGLRKASLFQCAPGLRKKQNVIHLFHGADS